MEGVNKENNGIMGMYAMISCKGLVNVNTL